MKCLILKNNQNLSKWEYYLQLKKKYSALPSNNDSGRQIMEIELKLWNLLTQMSDDEMLEMSEDDRNWSKTFIESKKNEFFFQELERQKRDPPQDSREVLQRGFQHVFSQKEVLGGFLKQLGEQINNKVSNGLCPTCHGTLTTKQLNQYFANQTITCEHCNASIHGKKAFLDNLLETLGMQEGELLSNAELKERGIVFNEQDSK